MLLCHSELDSLGVNRAFIMRFLIRVGALFFMCSIGTVVYWHFQESSSPLASNAVRAPATADRDMFTAKTLSPTLSPIALGTNSQYAKPEVKSMELVDPKQVVGIVASHEVVEESGATTPLSISETVERNRRGEISLPQGTSKRKHAAPRQRMKSSERSVRSSRQSQTPQQPSSSRSSRSSSQQQDDPGNDVAWCKEAKAKYRVVPGKSWGSLKGAPRVEWAKRGCDTVVATGKAFSCDQQWGLDYISEWKAHEESLCAQGSESTVTCRSHPATSSKACVFENVAIDFSKAPVAGNSRSFDSGFLRGACERSGSSGVAPLPPGVSLTSSSSSLKCDMVEETPSFFMSHDLIFNLGHTISDFWIVFITMLALELDPTEFRLVNMDAIRGNGPAGRGNKIGWAGHPDWIGKGTFFTQYEKWFGHGVGRGLDYGSKTVCFKKAVFQAKPGPAHIWTSLEAGKNATTERCARETGNSWLLHKYNEFNRLKWGLLQTAGVGLPRLPPKQHQAVAVVVRPSITLIMRKGDNMRVFANEAQVVAALTDVQGAGTFRAVDFSSIPFQEQIELVHNTSLLIGMHGAALFHLLSMNLGSEACCGVVELYHKRWSQSEAVPTVVNMAKFLGMDYSVLRSKETQSVQEIRKRATGTVIDTAALRELAVTAVFRLSQRQ